MVKKRWLAPKPWGQNIKSSPHKPDIAISQCLLGDAVRYDGNSQYDADLIRYLQTHFNLLAICPEVEIGLGVPRPAVELTGDIQQPRMTGRDNPLQDITVKMQTYCLHKTASLSHISAYVCKSRSPSCGLHDTPVFQHQKEVARGAGLFTRAIQAQYPCLPVYDEKQLFNQQTRQQFRQQVLDYFHQQRQI